MPLLVTAPEWYELLDSVQYYVDNMYQPSATGSPTARSWCRPSTATRTSGWVTGLGEPAVLPASRSPPRPAAAAWDYLVSPAPLRHPAAAGGLPLRRRGPRDRLPPQRRAAVGRGRRDPAPDPRVARHRGRPDGRALRADLPRLPVGRRQPRGDGGLLRLRGGARGARRRLRDPGPRPRVQRPGQRRGRQAAGLIDVTDYPDVTDLCLASDAAVLDYSSLRFDYALTGKPMIFLVPTLQRYHDTRGGSSTSSRPPPVRS